MQLDAEITEEGIYILCSGVSICFRTLVKNDASLMA